VPDPVEGAAEETMDKQGQAEAVGTDVEADETAAEEFEAELGDAGRSKSDGFIDQEGDL
jgi:hypothetical protein